MIDIEKLVGQVSNDVKTGSTRLVYFPVNKRKILLDGIETEIETVLKVGKPHKLEMHTNACELGACQNKIECQLSNSNYSVFIKNSDGSYTTNYDGILTPILQYDADFNWLEMVKVINPMTVPIFNKFTGGEGFPAGLFFDNVKLSLHRHYGNLTRKEGEQVGQLISDEKYNLVIKHPWVKTYISFMEKLLIIPYDFNLRNLGYIIHPITKKEIMVICDYGYTKEYDVFFDLIEKKYA
jgi:hypothetical protein